MKNVKFGGFWGAGLGVGISGAAIYGLLMYPQTEMHAEKGQLPVGEFRSLAEFDLNSPIELSSQPVAPGSFLKNEHLGHTVIADLEKSQSELPSVDRPTTDEIQLAPELLTEGPIGSELTLVGEGNVPADDEGELKIQLADVGDGNDRQPAFTSDAVAADTKLAALVGRDLPRDAGEVSEPDIVPLDESGLADESALDSEPNRLFEIVGTSWKSNPFIEGGRLQGGEVNGRMVPVIEIASEQKSPDLIPPVETERVASQQVEPQQAGSILEYGLENPVDPTRRFKSDPFALPAGIDNGFPVEDAAQQNVNLQNPVTTNESNLQSWANIPDAMTPADSSAGPTDPYSIAPIDLGLSEAAAQRAVQHIEYGKTLARRGATFAARQEFYSALRVLAQSRDGQTGVNEFSLALRTGILVLRESEDFMVRDVETQMGLNVSLASETHRTNVLTDSDAKMVTPDEAMQRYHAVAQEQLQMAGGHNVVSAEALYCLGKLHSAEAETEPTGGRADSAKAMVYHRAALASDESHNRAANELGVLLARAGKLQEARDLFKKSLIAKPVPQAWENLAKVHERMNEPQMAQLAQAEFQRSVQVSPSSDIQWKLPTRFNADAPIDFHEAIAAKPVASPTPVENRKVEENPELNEKSKSFSQTLKDLF